MTIASEIQRIKDNIAASYAECSVKGATLPAVENSASLPDTIASISGGGGGGATVTAVNKTGAAISQGDKVWINSNVQTAGGNYKLDNYSGGSSRCPVISRTGNFGWNYSYLLSIGAESATTVGSFTSQSLRIRYLADNSMFLDNNRVDDTAQYAMGGYMPLGNDLCYIQSYNQVTQISSYNFYKINMANGEALQTWNIEAVDADYRLALVGDKIYDVKNSSYYELGESPTATESAYTWVNKESDLYPAGVTADGKYIICSTNNCFSNDIPGGYLRLVEVVDSTHLKCLQQTEMPADLQQFYNANCHIVFNPYTGILTLAVHKSTAYAVMKYAGGVWSKLPFDLSGFLGTEFWLKGSITVSDDLSRACVNYSKNVASAESTYWAQIVNMSNTSGYAAVPYKAYNVTADTITGYAKAAASAGNSFEANVASVS